jgi:hypothetical protein
MADAGQASSGMRLSASRPSIFTRVCADCFGSGSSANCVSGVAELEPIGARRPSLEHPDRAELAGIPPDLSVNSR